MPARRSLLRPFVLLGLSSFFALASIHATAANEVKLGLLGSLTGPHAGWDAPASEGAHMAVSEINAAGGVKVAGKSYALRIVEEDSQSKPDFAVSGAQKILSDDDVHVMFGMMVSTPGMASAVPIAKAKVLYVGGFTLMDSLLGKPGNELMFRSLPSDEITGKYFVPEVTKRLGLKKMGILYPNEDATRAVAKVYQQLFEKAGVEIPVIEFFQPGTTDFAPVLRKFQNKGLDGLFLGNSDPDTEAMVRQSLELGGLPKKFVYRGGSGAPAAKYVDRIDAFAWQILTRDLDTSTDPKVTSWIERYKKFSKKSVNSTTYWALTYYDSVFMVARAMEAAGTTTDPKAIAAKLRGSAYDGVRRIRYDNEGRAHADVDIGLIQGGKSLSLPVKVD